MWPEQETENSKDPPSYGYTSFFFYFKEYNFFCNGEKNATGLVTRPSHKKHVTQTIAVLADILFSTMGVVAGMDMCHVLEGVDAH